MLLLLLVALYLQYIEDSSKSKAAAEEAVYTLNWVHNLAGLESPTQSTDNVGKLEKTTSQAISEEEPSVTGYLNGLGRRLLQTSYTSKCLPWCSLPAGFFRISQV